MQRALLCVLVIVLAATASSADPIFAGEEYIPADAIILFNGKSLSEWVLTGTTDPAPWKVENGYAEVRGGNISTKQSFGDCQLHVEFWLPIMLEAQGQARANSGVYLPGFYEVQVLDSYGLDSRDNDCGAIYGVAAPIVNACRPPGKWQTYDIVFRAPRFDAAGNKTANARMTVFQNGVLIHDNQEVAGPTGVASQPDHKGPGQIMLQDHGNPVRYRGIWVRALKPG